MRSSLRHASSHQKWTVHLANPATLFFRRMNLDGEVAAIYTTLKDFQSKVDETNARVAFTADVERARRTLLSSLEHTGQVLHYPHAFMTTTQWRHYLVLDDVCRDHVYAQLAAINPMNVNALVCTLQGNGLPIDPDEDACLYLALKDGLSKIDTHVSNFLIVGIKKAIQSFARFGQTAITFGVVEADYDLQREIRAYVQVDDVVRTSINAMIQNQSTHYDERVATTIAEFVNIERLDSLFRADTVKDLRKQVLCLPAAFKEYRDTTLANIDRTKRRRNFDTIRSVACSTLLGEIRDLVASTMYVRTVAI